MTQQNKNTPKKATKASTKKKTSATNTKWTPTIRPLPRVKSQLLEEVGPIMMREFNYSSVMEFPRLDKIVVNVGLGEALTNSRAVENTLRDIAMITGQNPVSTKAKKSIAGFKIREGMTIGVKVTLRRRRMYEFFDRLISSSLPRIRDFRGLSRNSFDGRGNYSMGITEQVIFPEIDYNSIDKMRGMQIVIGTTANSDQEGLRLLELLGMPFVRINDTQNG
jgi:large subunit ribosomal protein L5|tara:strand:+ start:4130 stop:4792 length:663 start_codon:yes stop_codon:yes gene_type:complete